MAAAQPTERKTSTNAANPQAPMSVRGLGIRFKTSHGVWQATRKIDYDIAPGERVGIVGESGCGKTITGLSILRLLPNNLAGLDGSTASISPDAAGGSQPQLPRPRYPATEPELGTMLARAYQYMEIAPEQMYAPGLAILVVSLAFNALGESLRIVLDPTMRDR